MAFSDLGLAPELLRALAEKGYVDPTPIQAQAIPIALQGKDLMGGAQTGTGKTAGFTLPLLQRLSRHQSPSPSPARHPVRALVLTPTRELAFQVYDSVKTYGKYLQLRSMCIYGGVPLEPQMEELRQGREIVVATPGRLLDHVQQRSVSFANVEVLVLDEADRMLDMGFIPDVKRILALLPGQRQSLLFSATFSPEIRKLADSMLREPVLIQVSPRNTAAETIAHRLHLVATDDKRALLAHILKSQDLQQVLVFVSTKFGCSRLAHYLTHHGINAIAIHGDKSQREREEALVAFKNGNARVLVATDVAARGIDIDDLPHVINYELPNTPEDYVHRIGRTGRAGKSGQATSLVCAEERGKLAEIEKLINRKIEQIVVPDFESEAHFHTLEKDRIKQRTPRRTEPHREPRRQSSAKPASDGFDFSKPYEPSTVTAPSQEQPERQRSTGHRRPIPALLGGLRQKEDKQ